MFSCEEPRGVTHPYEVTPWFPCAALMPAPRSPVTLSSGASSSHTQLDGHEKHFTPTIFLLVAQRCFLYSQCTWEANTHKCMMGKVCRLSSHSYIFSSKCKLELMDTSVVLGFLDHYADCADAVLGSLWHVLISTSACRTTTEHDFHYTSTLLSCLISGGLCTLYSSPLSCTHFLLSLLSTSPLLSLFHNLQEMMLLLQYTTYVSLFKASFDLYQRLQQHCSWVQATPPLSLP